MRKLDASLVADLWVFRVAAETSNFSRAGEALAITQSAVTQRIQRLEARLGIKLFERERGGLKVTHTGNLLLRASRSGFDTIETCLVQIAKASSRPSLSINCTPSLTLDWLTTRLAEFTSERPDIDVRIFVEMRQLDTPRMISEDIDVVVRYGPSPMPGANVIFDHPEKIFPVSSPELKSAIEQRQLGELVLLHDATPWANTSEQTVEWSLWLSEYGQLWDLPTRDRFFNMAHLAYQSAMKGEGVALGRSLLVKSHIAAGRLVALSENQPLDIMKYFVSTQTETPPAHVREFTSWLHDRMMDDE